MSSLNARAADTENDVSDELDMETLSTGLENFDETLERQGLRMGSLVAILAEPDSPGDILVANMIANRPAYYYSFGRSEKHIRRNIEPLSNVNFQQVHVNAVDSETPIETLQKLLDNSDLPRGATVIVDPANALEEQSTQKYKSLLRTLQKKVEEKDGIGILYGVEADQQPQNRWLTTYTCDTVLEVLHQTSDETVKDYLAVQKLYPGQNLIDEDHRVFELTQSLDIDIATSRNISP